MKTPPRTRPGIDLSLLQNLTMLTTCNVKRMYVCRSVFKRDWASRTFYVSIVVLDSEKFANFPDRFIHHARNQLIAKKVCTWIIRRFSIYSWNNRDRAKEGEYLIYWRGERPLISFHLITVCPCIKSQPWLNVVKFSGHFVKISNMEPPQIFRAMLYFFSMLQQSTPRPGPFQKYPIQPCYRGLHKYQTMHADIAR